VADVALTIAVLLYVLTLVRPSPAPPSSATGETRGDVAT
jgi:hypothetical protein